jgi:hypothetical protein
MVGHDRAPLRRQLEALLEPERLDDGQYQALRRLIEESREVEPRHEERPRRAMLLSVAAAVLVLVSAAVMFNVLRSPDGSTSVVVRVAEEVATNHIKLLSPDLETSSMEVIRRSFDRLDFVPIESSRSAPGSLGLKGARYCTLQGRIAAQLFYDSLEGEPVTRFQAAYDRHLFGALPIIERQQEPLVTTRRGVEIRLWVEQDVVVAEARTVATRH